MHDDKLEELKVEIRKMKRALDTLTDVVCATAQTTSAVPATATATATADGGDTIRAEILRAIVVALQNDGIIKVAAISDAYTASKKLADPEQRAEILLALAKLIM